MKLTLKNPPTFCMVGKKKPKKVYLTQNSLNSRNHFFVVDKLLDYGKSVILDCYNETYESKPEPVINPNSICVIIIKTKKKISENVNWDVDNRGNFWAKVFLDLIQHPTTKIDKRGRTVTRNEKGLKLLLNDNAYWIKGIVEFYQKSDSESIDFIISDKVKILIPNDL